jgi:splicing factor 3B subunit 4
VYIGNIDERATDSLIWELMLQAGRIVNVHLPKDRVTQSHQGYGFVEFISEEDAEYAARIMNQVRLYGKPIRVNKASADKQKTLEIGAELFLGNLDPLLDEGTLYSTFSRFGSLLSPPKIARDENGLSKGYGFISYSSFEASDDAIANMNGQFLMNKEISVQYAYKKDGKGERHGDQAERMLAAQARKHNVVPESQAMPPGLMGAPAAPSSMLDGPTPPITPMNGMGTPVQAQGFAPPPQVPTGPRQAYNAVPPPRQGMPLPPPPVGLPQRPPPSQAGYGGPQDFHPPGFGPPGFMPQQLPPGFGPPGGAPSGPPGGLPYMPPPGLAPPQGPPGYARR